MHIDTEALLHMKNGTSEYLPTRKTLLSRLKNWDDNKSWQEFSDTYRALIYGVAIKAGLTAEEAQDAVQETLLTVAKEIRNFKYDPKGSFKAWLLKTARWRIADQFRKRLPMQPPSSPSPEDTSPTSTVNRIPDPDGSELAAVCEEEWEACVGRLAIERVKKGCNPLHFQIFDLYARQGLPVEQIVRTLHVSEDLVYQVKSRFLKRLHKEIIVLEAQGI